MSAPKAAESFLAESILRRFTRCAGPAIYIPVETRVHVDIVSGIRAEIRSVGIVTCRIEVLLAHHVGFRKSIENMLRFDFGAEVIDPGLSFEWRPLMCTQFVIRGIEDQPRDFICVLILLLDPKTSCPSPRLRC